MSILNALTSGGGVALTGDTAGNLVLQSAGTTFATGNQYGIGLGTAVPSSGIGIAFPATQSASSDANTLDDYEEGTWTPTIGGNATYNSSGQTGIYTKIGNVCTIHFKISIAVKGTGSSTTLSGLPFASATNSALDVYSGKLSYFNTLPLNVVYMSTYVNQGATTCRFPLITAASSATNDNATMFQDGTTIYGSVTYMTA